MIMCMSIIASCIIHLFILLLVFFSKKNVDNFETKIYRILIILNLFGLIIEFCCCYTVSHIDAYPVLNLILNRVFLIYFIGYLSLFSLYTRIVTKKEIENRVKYEMNVIIIIFVILSIVSLILPIEFYNQNDVAYSYGLATDYVMVLCIIMAILNAIMIFSNIKKLKVKKFIPFFSLLVIFTFGALIRIYVPELTLINSSLSLVTTIMFFTIENPDAKIAELEKLAKELAIQQSKAKSEFLSSMSHELRTPLNAIVGLSEDIETFKSEVPYDVREDSEDIINASNTLLELIGSILDISKIESGKLEIVESDYNPKEEIESLVKIQRTKVAEKPLEFISNIDAKIPEILYGDRLRIKQILNNLISNAIKYTDKGKIDFSVVWDEQKSSLIIKVADTGKGIREEDKDKLFAKFERLQVEKVSSVQGTGLGLSITKNLIELMGGEVSVDSVYGQGSTFNVIIPQKIGDKEAYEKNKVANLPVEVKLDYTGMKLLVVDDNPLNIKVLKKAIKTLNFEIDEGVNGQEAINLVKAGNKYDLILMDILMPVMGGQEALENLKQIPGFNIPVVALTADAMTGAKEKYMSMGFVDYLAKPFSRDVIAQKISSILGNNNVKSAEVKAETVVENNVTVPTLDNLENTAPELPSEISNEMQEVLATQNVNNTSPIINQQPNINYQVPPVYNMPVQEVPMNGNYMPQMNQPYMQNPQMNYNNQMVYQMPIEQNNIMPPVQGIPQNPVNFNQQEVIQTNTDNSGNPTDTGAGM